MQRMCQKDVFWVHTNVQMCLLYVWYLSDVWSYPVFAVFGLLQKACALRPCIGLWFLQRQTCRSHIACSPACVFACEFASFSLIRHAVCATCIYLSLCVHFRVWWVDVALSCYWVHLRRLLSGARRLDKVEEVCIDPPIHGLSKAGAAFCQQQILWHGRAIQVEKLSVYIRASMYSWTCIMMSLLLSDVMAMIMVVIILLWHINRYYYDYDYYDILWHY